MTRFSGVHVIRILLLLCVGAPLDTQAAPPKPVIASFPLAGGVYKVPLPSGYCLPTGTYAASAKLAASADDTNRTDITFYRCSDMVAGAKPASWGMIKTPLSTLREKVPPRAELIGQLKSQVDPVALKQLNDQAAEQAMPQARRVFGQDLKVGMDAKAVGSDNFGIYFAGTLTVANGKDSAATLAIAYAITVARGNVFAIYIYGPYRSARDVLAILAKIKSATPDFVTANGG